MIEWKPDVMYWLDGDGGLHEIAGCSRETVINAHELKKSHEIIENMPQIPRGFQHLWGE